MHVLAFILLTTVLLDAPGEMGPTMLIMQATNETANNFDQTLSLHPGWNLVSWNINIPDPDPIYSPYIRMDEILDPNAPNGLNDWFFDHGGQVYTWEFNNIYYPAYEGSEAWEWNRNYAYYLYLDQGHLWAKWAPPLSSPLFTFVPKDAWDAEEDPYYGRTMDPYTMGWFFMGYSQPGYMKLGSTPDGLTNGNPLNYDYVGPFHWNIWYYDQQNYPHIPINQQYLVIVKTDDGRAYIPQDPNFPTGSAEIDQIGVLEPGKGYFLGFRKRNEDTDFRGWDDDQYGWQCSLPPQPKGPGNQIASTGHFLYKKYTHWSYPVVIDTIDMAACSLSVGDEIGLFDGNLCVGASYYTGEFPLVVTCWKDDIATASIVDGYGEGHEMTFIWFDVSSNCEIEFLPPPTTQALEVNPMAPSYAGFGAGAYARRSFGSGMFISTVKQLPQSFKLGQNYPNPFNAETIIPLELPQRSDIKIELFNVRGQSLGVIFNGVREAGWPKIHYNAVGLASGMYFCRVTAKGLERGGNYQSVGKLLLLK